MAVAACGARRALRFEKASCGTPKTPRLKTGPALEQEGEFEKAREAYERALKLDRSLYIQQNYDLFREADDKRNRKAKKKP